MAQPLVVSCSLNPDSHSRILAQAARAALASRGAAPDYADLRDADLPHCDGAAAYGHAAVAPLAKRIGDASVILVATPIYNYDVSSPTKNLLELTGKAWSDKLVGFLCASGGHGSYMAVMSFANSLMLDYRCMILPRFVFAAEDRFADGKITDPDVAKRVDQLAESALRIAGRLAP